MNKPIQQLYQQVILQEDEHPYHYFKMEEPDHVIEAYNQFCGDQFYLYLKMEADKIMQASFHGYGCAISKASTSLLTRYLEGKSLSDIQPAYENFRALIYPDEVPASLITLPKPFRAFKAAQAFPGRRKCAILSWQELVEFFREQK